MQAKTKIQLLTGFCAIALALGFAVPGAKAQSEAPGQAIEATTQAAASAEPKAAAPKIAAKRYFVEFRSRSALSYGHAFLVHGKLNAKGEVGQVTKDQVEGFHPFSESSVPWMVGHVVPVVAEHGFSDGDIEDEYITARYRVLLTDAEYANVSAYMAKLKKSTPLWHAVLYNCISYIDDVAKHMGLKTPSSNLLWPDEWINKLAELNGGKVQTVSVGAAAKPAVKRTTASAPAAPKPTAATTNASPKPATAPPAAKPAATAKPAVPRQTAAAAPHAIPAAQPEPTERY